MTPAPPQHNMRSLAVCLLLILALITTSFPSSHADSWGGANSFPLYALNQNDRLAVLDAMQAAKMKVLRVFITEIDAAAKGSSAVHVNDVEHAGVGVYDNTILDLIDQLMSEAKPRGIKLIIALHGRYALGCYNKKDAYTVKYNLPVVENCGSNAPDISAFYTNPEAVSDFKKRIAYIMNYPSPHMGIPWKYASEAILSFEPQNEAFGHVDIYDPNWWCNMCSYIKSILGTTPILVSTGGGTDFSTSLYAQNFQCNSIDIISVHSYDTSSSDAQRALSSAVSQAKSHGKRIILEEFGAITSSSSSKWQLLSSIASAANDQGVPWLFWEVMIPGQGAYVLEVSPTEYSWTNALAPASQKARTLSGAFDWSSYIK